MLAVRAARALTGARAHARTHARTSASRLNNTRLLLLNWRDPWHPQSGGAELLTWRICERLVCRGWCVEWFTARYDGARHEEMRDGIHFVRAGTQVTVQWAAFLRYRKDQPFDCVVEEVNTVPFFTPLYLRAPKAAFFCQLAREVWYYEAPRGFASVGYFAEPLYLQPYRRLPLITISQSSAASLRNLGLRGPTHVLPMAVDETAIAHAATDAAPYDVLAVGRLTRSKRIEHCIAAARIMASKGWRGRLHIVGDGRAEYVEALRSYAHKAAPGRVVFHGRVTDAQRRELLLRCAVLWATSAREGWGLVVTEAARCGRPAVVYDVAGLRDAVADGETGYVVTPAPQFLADATLKLFADRYAEFATNALERSRAYSWEGTTDAFETALLQVMQKGKRASPCAGPAQL